MIAFEYLWIICKNTAELFVVCSIFNPKLSQPYMLYTLHILIILWIYHCVPKRNIRNFNVGACVWGCVGVHMCYNEINNILYEFREILISSSLIKKQFKNLCYSALHTLSVSDIICVYLGAWACVRLDGHGRQRKQLCSSSLAVINRYVSFPMVLFAWWRQSSPWRAQGAFIAALLLLTDCHM